MNRKFFSFAGCIVVIFAALWACAKPAQQAVEIKHYPIDALDGIITQSGVQFDSVISKDGKGSLKITTAEPTVIRLFEAGDIDIEDARLIYQAKFAPKECRGRCSSRCGAIFRARGSSFPVDFRALFQEQLNGHPLKRLSSCKKARTLTM